jgi:hypothetical protein
LWQAIVTLYCFLIFLGFAILYPLDVVRRIRKGVLYDRPQDHETYIQGIEIEYMAGLSKVGRLLEHCYVFTVNAWTHVCLHCVQQEWAHANLWLFSSFHRPHSYYWVYNMYYKLTLILLSWLRSVMMLSSAINVRYKQQSHTPGVP